MQIVRIGLDLAKYVFEVHGVDAHGKIVVRKTLRRDAVVHVLRQSAAVSSRHGSLERRALLGKGAYRSWPRGTADQPSVCDAICEVEQERPE